MGIVAVTGTRDIEEAGAIAWWRLRGTTDVDRLTAAWQEAGLENGDLPGLPSPETALRRAVRELERPHRLVRSIETGWAVVDEQVDGERLAYDQTVNIGLDPVGRIVFEPVRPSFAAEVEVAFEAALRSLATPDVSGWLSGLVTRRTAGIPLRPTGGMYFIPRPDLAFWRKVQHVVRVASDNVICEIPAFRTEEAATAILDSLTVEAEAEAKALEAELDRGLGPRALQTRGVRCEAALAKFATYEALLGVKLDALRAGVVALQGRFAAAVMTLDAAREAA